MSVTPDKSALEKARERLEEACKYGEGIEASIGWKVFEASQSHRPISTGVHASDLRLVLDALKEAERRDKPDVPEPCAQCQGRNRRDMLCPACSTAHCWKCSECDDLGNPEDWE